MEGGIDALIASGNTALETGDWATARAAFEAALEQEDVPEAMFGLGDALWWLGEIELAIIETARVGPRLSREGFWEQRLRLGSSRARLESLVEEARSACLARARQRLGGLADEDFHDHSEGILAVARSPRPPAN